MKAFLSKINFKDLKGQKQVLLKKIKESKVEEEKDSLTGLLHLIDAIQDEAIDKYGYNEKDVFFNIRS